MIFSLSAGRFTGGVVDAVLRPADRRSGPLVVYLHGGGAGVTAAQANDVETQSGVRRVLRSLTAAGFVVCAPTAPDTWGNATGISRCGDAIEFARAELGAVGPAVLVGASHGGVNALNYAAAFPEDVACVIGLGGVVDMEPIRVSDLWGMRGAIDAAHGVVYPAALPAGANPADNAGEFVGVPIQWHVANDDEAVPWSTVTSFAAVSGADVRDLGALGHSNEATLAVDVDELLEFVGSAL